MGKLDDAGRESEEPGQKGDVRQDLGHACAHTCTLRHTHGFCLFFGFGSIGD